KEEYKLFNIRLLKTPNDYAMLQEALVRRQNHPEWGTPDLVLIDGGKGQLRAALKVWQWTTPVISIAKKPDRIIIPILPPHEREKNAEKMEAEIHDLKGLKYHELSLEVGHPALTILQQVRDEAHRFSKRQHTRL